MKNYKKPITNKAIKTPEYWAYQHMLDRCRNKNNCRFKDYGGRGITVCDRWKESYNNFLDDMGIRPSNKHSLDRINNDGNYEPSNCRWATIQEQSLNKRPMPFSIMVTHNNETKTLSEWARILNFKYTTVYRRLTINKMDFDSAINLPLKYNGSTYKR